MLKQAMEHKSLTLAGKVHCNHCHSLMTLEDGEYSCPNSFPECASVTQETSLLGGVMGNLVARVTTEETMAGVTAKMKSMLDDEFEKEIIRLLNSQGEIARLRREKAKLSEEVESGTKTYSETAMALGDINSALAGLEHEAMQARNEYERIKFITDPVGIRETAKDFRTYFQGSDPELVQELLDLLVKQVSVSKKDALVTYTESAPGPSDDSGPRYDLVALV